MSARASLRLLGWVLAANAVALAVAAPFAHEAAGAAHRLALLCGLG